MANLNARQQQLLEQIQAEGELKINELKLRYDVTEMTIRRDLEKLEKLGDVRRTFGGVVWIGRDVALQVRAEAMREEKNRIGKKAAAYVQPGESVFIDGGSTTLQIARSLTPLAGLTVVTNALNVAAELQNRSIPVIVTGGMLRESTSSMVGPIASQAVSQMVFDRAFLGTSGFTASHGFSNTNLYEAEIKRLAIKQAKQANVVMDHSKFGVKVLFSFAEIGSVHRIVTDEAPDEEIARQCMDTGLEIVVADDKR